MVHRVEDATLKVCRQGQLIPNPSFAALSRVHNRSQIGGGTRWNAFQRNACPATVNETDGLRRSMTGQHEPPRPMVWHAFLAIHAHLSLRPTQVTFRSASRAIGSTLLTLPAIRGGSRWPGIAELNAD